MVDIVATVRFGPRVLTRAARAWLGSTVTATLEFRDRDNADALYEVAGVALGVTKPDASTQVWVEGDLTAAGTGTWTLSLSPSVLDQIGDYVFAVTCTSPTPEAGAGILRVLAVDDVSAGDAWTFDATAAAASAAASAAAAAAALGGIGSMALQNSNAVAIAGGTWNGGSIGLTTRASGVAATYFLNGVAGAQVTYAFGAGAADAYDKGPLWLRARWTGTVTAAASGTGSEIAVNKLLFQDNALNSVSQQAGLLMDYVASGNTATGNQKPRIGLLNVMRVTGQYGDTSGDDNYIVFYPQQNEVWASATQGGAGGWPGIPGGDPPNDPYARGEMMGGHDLAYLKSGATNWRRLVGREIAISCATGASVMSKAGLHIAKKDDDVVAASVEENAIEISSQLGSLGWDVGLAIGRKDGSDNWPIKATGTLIAAKGQQWPSVAGRSAQAAAYGVDLREATFSAAAFASNGFSVADNGDTTMRTAKVSSFAVASLPSGSAGMIAFATNGRKNGEGAAAGTGVMVFHDGAAWRACDTGATVAA